MSDNWKTFLKKFFAKEKLKPDFNFGETMKRASIEFESNRGSIKTTIKTPIPDTEVPAKKSRGRSATKKKGGALSELTPASFDAADNNLAGSSTGSSTITDVNAFTGGKKKRNVSRKMRAKKSNK